MSDIEYVPPKSSPIASRSLGPKNGVEYVRALPRWLETAWPAFEVALREAGCDVDRVGAALFETAAQDRPAHHDRHTARGRRAVIEEKLAPLLRRGLPLKLAAAQAGVPLERVKGWCRADPAFKARLEGYRRAGVSRVHGLLLERAEGGSETAIVKALEYSGEEEYTPRLRVGRITDEDVEQSEPYRRFVRQVEATVCSECRERLKGDG
jgi:hypothetical protein